MGLWGWMNKSGPGELIEIGGRLNGEGYKDILQDVLLPTAQIILPDMAPLHFIHDNCSIHMARVCRAWIHSHQRARTLTPLKTYGGLWSRLGMKALLEQAKIY